MKNQFKIQLENIQRQKKLLIALILFFVVIIFWLIISIFITQRRTLVGSELIRLAQPLVPSLNREVLEKLEDKKHFSDDQLDRFSIYVLVDDRSAQALQIMDIIDDSIVVIDDIGEDAQQEEEVEEEESLIDQEQVIEDQDTEPQPSTDEQENDEDQEELIEVVI